VGGRAHGRRTGRRPGGPDTRADILVAARELFAERGFDGATIRSVADGAGVDTALIYHYFGSKQQLFVAAMQIPYHYEEVLSVVLDGPADEMGVRLVRELLGYWEDPRVSPLFRGIVRSAVSDPVAAEMVRRMLAEGPFALLARRIGSPDAELRAMLMASHVMGTALLRYVLAVEPLASAPAEEVARMVGPVIQGYLHDTELPAGGQARAGLQSRR
jgi:AcrR family transcriptional regulator